MANEQNQEQGPKGSLKDEILEKIRKQDEKQRQAAGVYDTASTRAAVTAGTPPGAAKRGGLFGPSVGTMALYCRQLATLVDVGIPLLRSLQILSERSSNGTLRRTSADLARRVEEGQPVSTAMMAHPSVFSPMFVGVVRSGEAGGILEDSLRRLADMLERRDSIRKRVIGAMIYPIMALVVELTVIGIIVFWALPKLISAYPDQSTLPAPTKILLGVSHWGTTHAAIVLIAVAVIIVLIFLFLRTASGRGAYHRCLLHTPLVGRLVRKINVSRFARTLGSLTAAGIPLIDALAITADTADNAVVEKTLLRVRTTVEHGGKMEEPMRSEPIFDPIVVDMVMVGDEAGALDTMLLKIADSYDQEVDTTLRMLTSILEPLLICFLGITVGFIAIAVFLPYVSLVKNPAMMVE